MKSWDNEGEKPPKTVHWWASYLCGQQGPNPFRESPDNQYGTQWRISLLKEGKDWVFIFKVLFPIGWELRNKGYYTTILLSCYCMQLVKLPGCSENPSYKDEEIQEPKMQIWQQVGNCLHLQFHVNSWELRIWEGASKESTIAAFNAKVRIFQ